MPESNTDSWKALGLHHKTAEKLSLLKLSPEKAKEISDADLKEKYGITDENVVKIRAAVSGTPPARETAAKRAEPEKKGKGKKDDEDEGPPKTIEEKQKVIAKLIKDSEGLLKRASDPDVLYGKRTTGFTALDAELSDGTEPGGYPVGKPVLFAGGYQTGKTAAAIRHIVKTQEDPNAVCIWGDAENSFDAPWAKKQGVDLDRLLMVPAMIADEMIKKMEEVIKAVAPAAVVIDSIGSLLSWQEVMKDRDDEEYTKDISQDTMALTARFLGKLYRRWTPLIAKFKPTVILVTHIYQVIGSYAGAEEAKGGNAMKHSSHVMLWFSRRKGDQAQKEKIKMADGRVESLYTAYEVVITIHKTRQSPTEGHKVVIPFVYGVGLSEVASVIEMALNMNLLATKGSYYHDPSFTPILNGQGNNWVNGRDAVITFIKANPPVFEAILARVGTAMAADDKAPEEVADAPAAAAAS